MATIPFICQSIDQVIFKSRRQVQGVTTDGRESQFQKTDEYQLLHISILREYIFKEFLCETGGLTLGVKKEVDRERIVDDFVCLSFLLGNDFLPHLASADIDEGGLGQSLEV